MNRINSPLHAEVIKRVPLVAALKSAADFKVYITAPPVGQTSVLTEVFFLLCVFQKELSLPRRGSL